MKKFLSIISGLLLFVSAESQYVGIGTNSPQATLDVKGNQRTGGISHFMNYDSASGRFTWSGSNLWVTSPQYLMMHSASSEGLYYGNSQLEYLNSAGNPVFFTNWNNGNAYVSGKLGIGTQTPGANLHIVTGSINPFDIDGGSGVYMAWAENGIYRGYLG